MSDSEGVLKPKKYYLGFFLLLIGFEILRNYLGPMDPGLWKGAIWALGLSFAAYSIRFFLLWKHSKDGLVSQLGTSVLFFWAQAACLLVFIWRGEREGFVIGFFIAHFANLLIVVFAR
ncbi:hypothetical protein EHQ27_01420 [Leptospira wolffii]|uniref:hypothetical protein n=1 Tax=Leptospira wolffii TaxID=409998 RepID=UPI000346D977|nr:hypothetical protein [Leptospira wolffii]TGK55145.1 hypothetical protein EHQ32_18115 [Leptospira wolffii]TGK70554.1 hypothetical protein EHQ35_16395 [Leptospira wolffii]TGK77598.1 hypothetical protein EHQ27_01420 [Leptospira wolffii]TGL29909.1 hypothetical protein EHQ57_09245 [Leptospira wolffii]